MIGKWLRDRRELRQKFSVWKESQHDAVLLALSNQRITVEKVWRERVEEEALEQLKTGKRVADSNLIYARYVALAYKNGYVTSQLPAVTERAFITTQLVKDVLDEFFTEPSALVTLTPLVDNVLYYYGMTTNYPATAMASLLRNRLIFETGFDFEVQIKSWVQSGPSVISISVKNPDGRKISGPLNFHVSYKYNQMPFCRNAGLEFPAVQQYLETNRYQRDLEKAHELAREPANRQCDINDDRIGEV